MLCRLWRVALLLQLQVSGTPERPRLAVHKSNNHIYAQVCVCVCVGVRDACVSTSRWLAIEQHREQHRQGLTAGDQNSSRLSQTAAVVGCV